MKRRLMPKWLFYPVSFGFVLLAAVGMWLTWEAQVANFQTGLAVDQMLRVVSLAREQKFSGKEDAYQVQNNLIQRLVAQENMQSRLVSPAGAKMPQYALINPWGNTLNVGVSPSRKELRLVMPTNFQHCRRILSFFASNTEELNIKRVDVMPDSAFNLCRLVYDGRIKGAGNMKKEKIYINCGNGEEAAISLIFRLL